LVLDCFLEQHVREPTRLNNILDLVLTSDIKVNGEVQVLAPVDNADHNVLTVFLRWKAKIMQNWLNNHVISHIVAAL